MKRKLSLLLLSLYCLIGYAQFTEAKLYCSGSSSCVESFCLYTNGTYKYSFQEDESPIIYVNIGKYTILQNNDIVFIPNKIQKIIYAKESKCSSMNGVWIYLLNHMGEPYCAAVDSLVIDYGGISDTVAWGFFSCAETIVQCNKMSPKRLVLKTIFDGDKEYFVTDSNCNVITMLVDFDEDLLEPEETIIWCTYRYVSLMPSEKVIGKISYDCIELKGQHFHLFNSMKD